MSTFEKRFILGTEDPPLRDLLAQQNWVLQEQPLSAAELALQRLGIRTTTQDALVKITHVFDDGGAHKAGIAAGDLLVSINRERITPSNFSSLLERFLNQSISLMVFRQDILHECVVTKDARKLAKWQILPNKTA
jgi:predicted metalloprotease with PDZ domain